MTPSTASPAPASTLPCFRQQVIAALFATAAYFVAAKVGLLLALPAGFVSPLWPAAGVAVLLVMRLGYACLPGVAAGSLLSNITAGAGGGAVMLWPEPGTPYAALFAIAVGAATQAGLAVWLVRQVANAAPPGGFGVWPILRMLFRAGPLACLVNAVVALLVLPAFAHQPPEERLAAALVWWLGDALGVLGLMPLALLLLRSTAAGGGGSPMLTSTVSVLVSLTLAMLSWAATVALGRAQTETLHARKQAEIRELAHDVQTHLDRTGLMLESFRAFYESSQWVTAAEFQRFAKPWLQMDDMVTGVAWAPRVAAEERGAFEQSAPGYDAPLAIREQGADGQFAAAGARAEYWPLTLLAPLDFMQARGFDLRSEPAQREVLERALRHEGPVSSSPLRLVQDPDDGRSTAVLLLSRIQGNRPAVLGAAIRLDRLFEEDLRLFRDALPPGSRFRLSHDKQPLLDHALQADGRLHPSPHAPATGLTVTLPLRAADRLWQLEVSVPRLSGDLVTSASWWLGLVMPQVLAIILGLALINGALRQEHTLRLQDDFSRLLERSEHASTNTRSNAGSRHDTAVAEAWAARQFEPTYTPVVHLGSGLLRAVQSQVRWPGMPAGLSPTAVLDWAERSGQSAAVTRQLISSICAESRGWPLRRGDAFTLSVAVTPQAISTPGWAEGVLEDLAHHRLPGRRLCLELREDRLLGAADAVIEALGRLRDAGVRVGLTGFGTGRSTLTALRRLPVDRISIDPAHVRDVAHDTVAREIVRTLVQLAATLGMEVIADGADDEAAAQALAALDCPLAQGSCFSPLVDAQAVAVALAEPVRLWATPLR